MESKEERQKIILRVTAMDIVANILLSSMKIAIGVISSSISVFNDGINNLADSASAIVAIVFYSIGRKRPTRKHPLGYGRMEYLSALIVSAIVTITGLQCLKASIFAIIDMPKASFSFWGYIVILLSIFIKLFLSRMNIDKGRKTNSLTLIATGKDALSDVLISCATFLGAILAPMTDLPVDGIVGILVSLFIVYSGVSSILQSTSSIMGERPDDETVKTIRYIIKKHPPLKGGYDIMLHVYGPERTLGTCNVEVPVDAHAEKIFDAMTEAEKDIEKETGIYFTFGLFAVNDNREDVLMLKHEVLRTLKNMNAHILSLHAFHVHFEKNMVHFDVVVDYSVKDISEIRDDIYSELKKNFPKYDFQFTVDPEYD